MAEVRRDVSNRLLSRMQHPQCTPVSRHIGRVRQVVVTTARAEPDLPIEHLCWCLVSATLEAMRAHRTVADERPAAQRCTWQSRAGTPPSHYISTSHSDPQCMSMVRAL
eukprot:6200632-Pleurochrysis_carterae.AAC.2